MYTEISREFQFDAAHMLSKYEGKCGNLHGHTYTGKAVINGNVDETTGMLVDYNHIKNVIDVFDHALLFSDPDFRGDAEEELYKWAAKHGMKYEVIPNGKCTAENIVKYIAYKLILLPNVSQVKVWLHETPGSEAFYACKNH